MEKWRYVVVATSGLGGIVLYIMDAMGMPAIKERWRFGMDMG